MRLSTALVVLAAAVVSVSAAPSGEGYAGRYAARGADTNAARMARGLAPKAPAMKRTPADSARRGQPSGYRA